MTISQYHKEVADIAPRVPVAGLSGRRTRPSYTGQNKGLRRKYKAMKRARSKKNG